jgi:hypothetical protein
MLTENYRVRIERLNFVLEEKLLSKKKDTKEEFITWTSRGYYSNFRHLLEVIAESGIKKFSDDFTRMRDHFTEVMEMLKTVPDLIISLGERTIIRYEKGHAPLKAPVEKKKRSKKEGADDAG